MTHTPKKTTDSIIPLIIEETHGIPRYREPVTVGIPFPQGTVNDCSEIILIDPEGNPIPCQMQVLDRWWGDRSLKWLLCDFQVTVPANATVQYALDYGNHVASEPELASEITIERTSGVIVVDTGAATFTVNAITFQPFQQVILNGVAVLDSSKSKMVVLDDSNQSLVHTIQHLDVETEGPLRTTLKIEGQIAPSFAEFFARIHFYADSAVAKIDYTIRNPKAAQHPGGLWDLGDEGSVFFNHLALQIALSSDQSTSVQWTAHPDQPFQKGETGSVEIYQDSSGGENWQSSNHVNRFGKVMHSFRGYRIKNERLIEEGHRASPIVAVHDDAKKIAGAVKDFWQNFPKVLEADGNLLTVSLFPSQYQDLFELQGGEQKTHSVFLSFESSSEEYSPLNRIQYPLIPHAVPEWYAQTGVIPYLLPSADDPYPEVISLLNTAIEDENSFIKRREIIDEYGWRNFGELYADHEKINYKGEGFPVSHYNNQYDGIYAGIIQFFRSGNVDWFTLIHAMAHHVVDIDIYHTDQDKPNYNGGLFWHTDHYSDAATCTHRGYSKATMAAKGLSSYGGGHSNEQDYATGLMYHYYLTGELTSKEAVLGLADWVINMDDGTKTKFKLLNTRPTGFASTTNSPDYSYHGPGRGAGYSINTLFDAHILSKSRKYLEKAEQLIRRCIHPNDSVESLELDNAELRWSYTVFLQAVGRYLDLKIELKGYDKMYCYARESLLHYAKWMRDHEVCFSTKWETLEFPTETWPAQDIRKSNVFKFAAKHAQEPLRSEFLQKSTFFFDKPLEDLFAFETKTLTRPLILLMTNTLMQTYFHHHPDEAAPLVECAYDFGQPQQFKPQLYHIYQLRARVHNILSIVKKILGR